MKLEHISQKNAPRLLLVFSGWASDASFFAGTVPPPGYDFAVASDYRMPASAAQTEQIAGYSEVCLIAWSFGVPAANRFMLDNPHIRFTLRLAINGTLVPVDDLLGIPEEIFRGTLEHLDTRNLSKFMRREAGSASAAASLPGAETFDISALKDELKAIAALPRAKNSTAGWDSVIISSRDAIIPPENQRRFWSGHPEIHEIDAPHLPDFASLIPSLLSDKDLVSRRFSDSATTYNANAGAQSEIASRLAALWREYRTESSLPILEIGPGTGLLTKEISSTVPSGEMELWDLSDIPDSLPGRKSKCDAESEILLTPPNHFGSIMSASTIQWFNSPATFLKNAARVLAPGGLLAVSTFTPGNFRELRPYLTNTPHYTSPDTIRAVIPETLEILELSEEEIRIDFPSPRHLLQHFRYTGVNAMHSGDTTAARAIISAGITSLTYTPLYLVARKKA